MRVTVGSRRGEALVSLDAPEAVGAAMSSDADRRRAASDRLRPARQPMWLAPPSSGQVFGHAPVGNARGLTIDAFKALATGRLPPIGNRGR